VSIEYSNYLPRDFPTVPPNQGAPIPLLSLLSGTTTVIGAYSTGRKLASAATSPFTATNISDVNYTALFTSMGALNTAGLLTFANNLSLGLTTWNDQSGSGNNLPLGTGNTSYPPLCGGGSLNLPITTTQGVMPLPSIGYNGTITGSRAPWFSLSPMITPFGAVAKFFSIAVFRPKSGQGSTVGRLTQYLATGDVSAFTATTSCILIARNGSTTTGAMATGRNSTVPSGGTGPSNTPTMQGIVYDGTNATYYIDRTGQTPGAFTGNLGATGAFAIGDGTEFITVATDNMACDIAEVIIGTFTSSAATFAAGDWTVIQNNMRAFWNTP